jgi:5-methyltetrahydropteroyltriglutamate--homocysteine methyltransferase
VAAASHPYPATVQFDGGDLDCGNGLLLLIRRHIDPLAPGQLLEIASREPSVADDLPAWCRLTGNDLVSVIGAGRAHSFLVSKGPFRQPPPPRAEGNSREPAPITQPIVAPHIPAVLPTPQSVPPIPPLAVMGIGSWPRPRWLMAALHEHLEGRLDDDGFHEVADDAVRLVLAAQQRAGVDVLTDGEQRRDSYASFVAGRLQNCQLIPITDLLPYVDDPAAFERELRALDVPAGKVRHPAVFGPLGRNRPLAAHELAFVRTVSEQPIKIALPGPYLLTRTMWMECISDRAYADRETLATDIASVLREEIHQLLADGAALVQLDEPVLSEVVFGQPTGGRSFMCGALGERLDTASELAFAQDLLHRTVAGLPRERLALHVCRGNWSRDEAVALRGDYAPLLPFFAQVPVGTLFLELCTERAGDVALLAGLPAHLRVGVGVVNQKQAAVPTVEAIVAQAEAAIRVLGVERVLLNPDCGFATFADNPIAAAPLAEAQLTAIAAAARALRQRHRVDR